MMVLAALEGLIAGLKVCCEALDRDQHGRLVAKVSSPDDVDRPQVGAGGRGLPNRRYSTEYVDLEDEAGKAKRGRGRAASSNAGCGAHQTRTGAQQRVPRHLLWAAVICYVGAVTSSWRAKRRTSKLWLKLGG